MSRAAGWAAGAVGAVVAVVLGVLMSVTASAAATPDLTTANWKLVGWSASSPIPKSVSIDAMFTEDSMSGSSGVNRYHASVQFGAKGKMTVGPVVSTLMAGPQDAMVAEHTYHTLLEKVAGYTLSGSTLVLTDKAGKELLTFSS